ncbi:MAG: cytotoxic translational repressor of toxin-antitoxin stability system [Calothrix sp. C42_A2020_038]|nr:cytotoxic translational repressor of toxin-antitoxin stability system [Calothrix sp. C42_A2020_038]
MSIEVRYARSFLADLKRLKPSIYEQAYYMAFVEFPQKGQLHYLPQLRQIDGEGIFYRFTLDKYLIGIELRGEIVKFLRVIPMPDVKGEQMA